MEVSIIDGGKVIWMRNGVTQEGVASIQYLKDGTQQNIIAALEEALFQAKGQLMLSDNVN